MTGGLGANVAAGSGNGRAETASAIAESGRKLPRRFQLVRHKDVSGVSGTGVVAEGALWSSGAVALHWPGYPQATSVWASVYDLIAAHGHEGDTEVVWIDDGEISPAAFAQPDQPDRDGRGWPVMQVGDCAGIGE